MAASLVALLAGGAPAAWAAEPTSTAAPLSVVSEPAGAAVFVDGDFKGETPLALDRVGSGEHNVRLVKSGYLENSRTVSVSPGGGSMQVRLTPTGVRPYATMQVDPGTGSEGKGGSKKWLWIGLGAVAVGAGVAVAMSGGNKGPTVSGVTATPSTALAGGSVSLSATASDPDGDSLTYTWNFGDGGTGSGQSTTHTYASGGSFSAAVEVSDGEARASSSAAVTIRTMAGAWRGNVTGGFSFTMNLAQSGTSISGSYSDADGPGTVSGTVTGPQGIRLTVNQPPYTPFSFTGSSTDLNSFTGSTSGISGASSFTLTRQ